MPKSFKYALVFTLIHRAFKLCSSYELFHHKLKTLKLMFRSNGYPISFTDLCVKNVFIGYIPVKMSFHWHRKKATCLSIFIFWQEVTTTKIFSCKTVNKQKSRLLQIESYFLVSM